MPAIVDAGREFVLGRETIIDGGDDTSRTGTQIAAHPVVGFDEGEFYAEKLKAARVSTALTRYDGVNHGFMFWVGVVDKAGVAMSEACEWLRGVFTGSR